MYADDLNILKNIYHHSISEINQTIVDYHLDRNALVAKALEKSKDAHPDMVSEFRQTGSQTIRQSGKTKATFDGEAKPLSVEIEYSIDGKKIVWSELGSQFLENANNTSTYDEKTKTITYDTDVRMLEKLE